MKRYLATILGILFCSQAYASDYHQSDQPHIVTYTVTLSTDAGAPVPNQQIGLALYRVSDGAYLDFSNNSFSQTSWNTRVVPMSYNARDGFYYRVLSIDNGGIMSGEYVAILSNDDSYYSDIQAESFELDSTSRLIKINR